MYDKKSEIASYIMSECENFAQNKYKRRNDNVGRIIYLK